jgi:hypothetical protein
MHAAIVGKIRSFRGWGLSFLNALEPRIATEVAFSMACALLGECSCHET